MKYQFENDTDSQLSQRITLRLRQDEYEKLAKMSSESGENVSQVVRRLMFKQSSGTPFGQLSESEIKQRQLAAFSGIKNTLKKVAKDFNNVVLLYEKNAASANASGFGQAFIQKTLYSIRGLEDIMVDAQRQINSVVEQAGWPTVHLIAKSPSLARKEESVSKTVAPVPRAATVQGNSSNNESKYSFMQKVTIAGNLATDVKVFQSQKGNEMMRIAVICDDVIGNEKGSTIYTVLSKKSGISEYLRKGRQVIVSGSQKVSLGKDAKGAPAVEITVYADDIVLGKE